MVIEWNGKEEIMTPGVGGNYWDSLSSLASLQFLFTSLKLQSHKDDITELVLSLAEDWEARGKI